MSASIRDEMQAGLRAAMRSRERLTVSVLRSTLAAVANAEAVDPATVDRHAVEVARTALTEDDVRAVVAAERDDLRAAVSEMQSLSQAEKAADLAQQAAILDGYLAGSVTA